MTEGAMHQDCWESADPEQTCAWGRRIGKLLHPGDILCLYGDLGAGKTLLAQGIGDALNVAEVMTSPTFTMMQQYAAEQETQVLTLVHMDLYRLRDGAEADVIGIWDAMQEDSAVIIEWPEIVARRLPEDRYELYVTGSGENPRGMRLCFLGATAGRWREWLNIRDQTEDDR